MDPSGFRFTVGLVDCLAVYGGALVCGPPDDPLDLDPGEVAQTRQALFTRAAGAACLVHAFHFPFPSLGRVRAHDSGWRWVASPDMDVE